MRRGECYSPRLFTNIFSLKIYYSLLLKTDPVKKIFKKKQEPQLKRNQFMFGLEKDPPIEILVENVQTQKMSQGKWVIRSTPVVKEIPLTIFLNDKEVVTLLCTGTHLGALAIGFLKSEGLIDKKENIQDITLDREKGIVMIKVDSTLPLEDKLFMKRTITSGCGKGTMFYSAIDSLLSRKIESSLKIFPKQIFSLMSQLNERSTLYKHTRGVHNAALASQDEIIFFRADIGRHNAVDIINGECFLNDIPLENSILLTTGRITSEVILKTAKMRIPIIISRNVATHHALTLANELGITIVGDVRAEKLIVYTHPGRILR